ncbi:glycosyltransferase [Vibrio gigantis]|uniref:glycosyltransferase n=1 Tax=Vibrio gigantis TaxID=296199 RepID=UPI001BFEE2BD|nr:glycosyltransferase [Vibrio gigantis]
MDTSLSTALELLNTSNEHFDLTEPQHQRSLLRLADRLLAIDNLTIQNLNDLSLQFSAPLEFKLAVKLVQSRKETQAICKPVEVGVVFAMWGEQNRLQPKSSDNPHGEDSLRTKVEQLQWVTEGTHVNWKLYAVDDGCPHGSASIAENIKAGYDAATSAKIQVLRLADALPVDHGALRNLACADDSRKGGAIILGCDQSLKDGVDAVLYTDADNSVHLGQIGLALAPYNREGKQVVLGNRKHVDSILVKQEERWGVGIKTLRHMQRMIGAQIFDSGIKDTQAAFKLYGRDILEKILENPTVFDFSFDTDWIFAAMEFNQPIVTVPFAFIDSAAESASVVQGPMTTWYVLLDGLVKAARARGGDYSEEMADVFTREINSHEDLELIINVLPPELAAAGDSDLGNPRVMSPQSVRHWITSAKSLSAQPSLHA